ncbi:MAG: hypothetical protein JXR19_07760 [Bacteroidia bacterium]
MFNDTSTGVWTEQKYDNGKHIQLTKNFDHNLEVMLASYWIASPDHNSALKWVEQDTIVNSFDNREDHFKHMVLEACR